MGRYYNRGRGNLPLSLANGHSTSVPGNKWIELHGADETTPSVMRAVRKGQLFRAAEHAVPALVEAKTEAIASEEDPQDAAPVEPKPQLAANNVAKKKATAKKKVSTKPSSRSR